MVNFQQLTSTVEHQKYTSGHRLTLSGTVVGVSARQWRIKKWWCHWSPNLLASLCISL